MPIRGHQSPLCCVSRLVDLRIISRSSARLRKAKGGRYGVTISARKGRVAITLERDLGYRPIRPSESFRQTCTFYVSRRRRLSFQVCSWRDPIGRSQQIEPNALRASHDPAVSNQPRSAQSNEYEMCYGKGETHKKAAHTSSTDGEARQKPGRVVVRHFAMAVSATRAG